MKPLERKDIASAVRAGEAGAVERLVFTFQDELYSYALGLLRDPFDAQEIVQDAFMRAHAALTTRLGADRCRTLALRPWLYRIARNLAFNRLRARKARREEALENGRERSGAAASGKWRFPPPDPEAGQTLSRALGLLGTHDRELLLLRFVDDLPYSDLAAVTGGSESAARGRVFRAVSRLRQALTRLEDHR